MWSDQRLIIAGKLRVRVSAVWLVQMCRAKTKRGRKRKEQHDWNADGKNEV